MGQARLQRVRRIYRRLESLAAVDHGHRTRRNVRHHEHFLRDRSGCRLDAREQMVRVADQRRIGRRLGLGVRSWPLVRQMDSQRWGICDVHRLQIAHFIAVAQPSRAAN